MNTQEKIEIMQAYLDGKEIEVRAKGLRNWNVCHTRPEWDWNGCEYRVKKAPKYRVIDDVVVIGNNTPPCRMVEIKALEDALELVAVDDYSWAEDSEIYGETYKALKALIKG